MFIANPNWTISNYFVEFVHLPTWKARHLRDFCQKLLPGQLHGTLPVTSAIRPWIHEDPAICWWKSREYEKIWMERIFHQNGISKFHMAILWPYIPSPWSDWPLFLDAKWITHTLWYIKSLHLRWPRIKLNPYFHGNRFKLTSRYWDVTDLDILYIYIYVYSVGETSWIIYRKMGYSISAFMIV